MTASTLTVYESFGALAGLGSIVPYGGASPLLVTYEMVSAPSIRIVFSLPPDDLTTATSFVITDDEGTLYAEAECSISIAVLDAALGDPSAVLGTIFGSVTTLELAGGADVDLATVAAGLTLLGNDLGTSFVITDPLATVHAGDGADSITGSTYADSIDAGDGDDTIIGGGGGDTIDAGSGDDVITITGAAENGIVNGGDGVDLVVFEDVPLSLTVDVAARTISFDDLSPFPIFVSEWTFSEVEYFRGSGGVERYRGNGEGTRFEGGRGQDYFFLSGGYTGEAFADVVDYSREEGDRGVVVNFGLVLDPSDLSALDGGLATALTAILAGNTSTTGNGFSLDTFGELDSIDAGFFIVRGTRNDDFFYGWSGSDVFEGGGGNDHFFGGDGDDTIRGGEGSDTFYLSLDRVAYDVTFADGVFTIVGDGWTDEVSGVETISFNGVAMAAAVLAPAAPVAPVAVDDSNSVDLVVEAPTSVSGHETAAGNVLTNDSDANDDPISVVGVRAGIASGGIFTAVGSSTTTIAGTYGSLKLSDDGEWTYTLNDLLTATNALSGGDIAHDEFTYRISDGTLFGEARLDIAIAGSNDAPAAADKTITIAEDGAHTFAGADFGFSDVDVGDTLQAVVIASLPVSGSLRLSGAGVNAGQSITVGQLSQLIYTPLANTNGAALAAIGFKVSDGSLLSAGSTITFNVSPAHDAPSTTDRDKPGKITVSPINNAPTTSDRTINIAEDTSFSFAASDFGFSDPDIGDILHSIRITSLPGTGTLKLGGAAVAAGQSIAVGQLSQLVFAPALNANGSPLTSFGFKVSDGTLESATKTVAFYVAAVNDAPVANADSGLVTAEDTPLTILATSLLANDTDAESDALAIASVGGAVNGTVVLNGDGTVRFTPAINFNGQASFSYRAKDGWGSLSGPATVFVSVTSVKDGPAFAMQGVGPNGELTVVEGVSEVYSPSAFGADSSTLSYSLEGPDADDFVFDGSMLRFALAPDFEAPRDSDADNVYDVTLVVSDGTMSGHQTLAVTVVNAGGNRINGTAKGEKIDANHKIGGKGATSEEDVINGKAGKDTIKGGGGDDTLKGDTGDDSLIGGAGNDLLRGGAGKDILDGGAGIDTADYADMSKGVVLTLNGSKQATARIGGAADDKVKNIENVTGGKGADTLTGDIKANVLNGGKGNDTVIGGLGNDTLIGGAGQDKFVFNAILGAANVDMLADFKHDEDMLQLKGSIFAAIGPTLDAGEFYAKAGAVKGHDLDDRIIYNTSTGGLYYDADGNKAGGVAAILFATLSTKPLLDVGDAVIV